jgi:hypothetical protein
MGRKKRPRPDPEVDVDHNRPTMERENEMLIDANLRLLSKIKQAKILLSEGMSRHADPESGEYNRCDEAPCNWCERVKEWVG